MKQSILNIFRKNSYVKNKKVIIWGSGSGYSKWKDRIEFYAEAVIDNNSKLWGQKIDGVPIVSPDYLIEMDKENTIVFILSYFYEEIYPQVYSYGFKESSIFCFKDIERTIFAQEKKIRQKQFNVVNELSLQEYIEHLEDDLKDIYYRGIHLLPVIMPYIALLTNYLFLKDSNSNLFPVPQKKEYYIEGNGPILVSYVWHEKRRPGLIELIDKSISGIPVELITKLKPKSFYDESINDKVIELLNDRIPLNLKTTIQTLHDNFSKKIYNLLDNEIDWIIDFSQYFLRMIDHYYDFFLHGNFKVLVTGFANNSEENIKVQIAKKLDIKTFGLQHGTFGKRYEFNIIPFSHVYKYTTVDELLVWGEYSKKIIDEIKLDKSIVVPVGNPRYNFISSEREKLKNCKNEFLNHRVFLICFIGASESEYLINQELLEFADKISSEFGIQYIVKMHPGNKVQRKEFKYDPQNCIEFISDNRDMNYLFAKIDFILTTSSVVVHEAIYQYLPIFVYSSHGAVYSICGTLSTVFGNYEELDSMFKRLMDKQEFLRLMEEYKYLGNQFIKSNSIKRPISIYKDRIMCHIGI